MQNMSSLRCQYFLASWLQYFLGSVLAFEINVVHWNGAQTDVSFMKDSNCGMYPRHQKINGYILNEYWNIAYKVRQHWKDRFVFILAAANITVQS